MTSSALCSWEIWGLRAAWRKQGAMSVVGGVRVAASVAVAGLLWLAPQPVALAEGSWDSASSEGADGGAGGVAPDAVGRQAPERGVRAGGSRGSGRATVGGVTGAKESGVPGRVIRSGRAGAGVYEDLVRGDKSLLVAESAVAPGVDGAVVAPRRASVVGGAESTVQVAESAAVAPAPVGRRVSGVADELDTAALEVTARKVAAQAAAVGAEASCGSCWAFGAAGAGSGPIVTAVNQALNSIGFVIERMLDGVDRWLLSLPPNPVTDYLAGALWMVRRTLFPVGPSVGMGGTASCVALKDCSGQDLTGVNLYRQNLTGVNFSGANLSHAELAYANLSNVDLSDATLIWAELGGADLSGANLQRADLTNASASATFDNANLSYAKLSEARFSWNSMVNADLSRAELTGAVFTKTNLTGASLLWANTEDAVWYYQTCPDGQTWGRGTPCRAS